MRFEALKQRVERTEELVAGRGVQTIDRYAALKSEWRAAWTPARIVVVGLISGFAVGHVQPGKAVSRLGQLGAAGSSSMGALRSIMGLVTSLQATFAALTAKGAADSAQSAADDVSDAADGNPVTTPGPDAPTPASMHDAAASAEPEAVPPVDRRRPDPVWTSPPLPAEAATDVSER